VAAAVRGLEKEYAGRVKVEFDTASSDAGRAALERHGWQKAKHGLEGFKADGTVSGNLPGHAYGEAEIRAEFEKALAK
jgi:hypothetical protein